jgi:hypothetical protein
MYSREHAESHGTGGQVYQFRNMRITVMTLFQMLNTKFDFKVVDSA